MKNILEQCCNFHLGIFFTNFIIYMNTLINVLDICLNLNHVVSTRDQSGQICVIVAPNLNSVDLSDCSVLEGRGCP